MGRGQVVRRLSLEQENVGSNPTAPANLVTYNLSNYLVSKIRP